MLFVKILQKFEKGIDIFEKICIMLFQIRELRFPKFIASRYKPW